MTEYESLNISSVNNDWLYEAIKTLLMNNSDSGWAPQLLKAWGVGEEVITELYNLDSLHWNEQIYFPIWIAQGTTARFVFPDTPHGTPIDCEVTAGAGEVKFFENGKEIASYDLSLEPGGTFYIRLNTDPDTAEQKWEIQIKGTGNGEKVVSLDGKTESEHKANQFKFTMVGLKVEK